MQIYGVDTKEFKDKELAKNIMTWDKNINWSQIVMQDNTG